MTKTDKLKGINPMAYPGMKDMNHTLPIDMVWKEILKHFKVKEKVLKSKSNKRECIVPRHVFFYLCKQFTTATLTQIAEYSSDDTFTFNHATVWHGINKTKKVMPFQPEYRNAVEKITEKLQNKRNG